MPSLAMSLAALLLCAGCIIPFAVPPIRAELGAAAPIARENPTSLQVAVGSHLASGTRRDDQPFDLGAGYLRSQGIGEGADDSGHGLYLDGALFISRSRRVRTSVGGRGELLWMPMGTSVGARLRIDHELFGTGARDFRGDNRCGVTSGTHIGTAAFGIFAEAGPQRLPGGDLAWLAAAGVTVRLPASVGVFIGIPGC
jgi:hypothetical protein